MKTILYIHGLGGGGDSRIPSILAEHSGPRVRVVCRTYDFDPDVAAVFLENLAAEVRPDLIIGESMGAPHALRLRLKSSEGSQSRLQPSDELSAANGTIPRLFVSPSLGAPLRIARWKFLAKIPGVRLLLNYLYRPRREGDRQRPDFRYEILCKYRRHYCRAIENAAKMLPGTCFAFFGTKDHYRRSGIVSIRRWEKLFGKDSYAVYDGTHYMEEEYLHSMLIPRIDSLLSLA